MNKAQLPNSELEIMLIIWEIGEDVSTSDIMNALKDKKTVTVQLVQSYLKRLENKKFIKVKKLGRLNFYKPLISLEQYRSDETNNFIDTFYQNSPTKLVATLIANKHISEEELEKIREVINKNGD